MPPVDAAVASSKQGDDDLVILIIAVHAGPACLLGIAHGIAGHAALWASLPLPPWVASSMYLLGIVPRARRRRSWNSATNAPAESRADSNAPKRGKSLLSTDPAIAVITKYTTNRGVTPQQARG